MIQTNPAAPPPGILSRPPEPTEPLPALERVALFVGLVTPAVGLVAGAALAWGWGFGWADLGLMAGMYLLTILGITVGYHRLFTHRAFEAGPVVRFVLAAVGGMAAQGPLIQWVATHRRHHQHSDSPGDPHSPHGHGGGVRGWVAGAWHSHVGWIFTPRPAGMVRYVRDLRRSRLLRTASGLYPVWVVLGLLIPAVLGGLLGGWPGAVTGFVWGGLVRVFIAHHVTFAVNSACHIWGGRPYDCGDESRNNLLFGVLALGEGWHNNHHAFPTSARHGLRWWQPDPSYWVIRGLALCGLVWGVRTPARRGAGDPAGGGGQFAGLRRPARL